MAVEARKSKKLHHKDATRQTKTTEVLMKTGTGQTCNVLTCSLMAARREHCKRTSKAGTCGLLAAHARNLRNNSSRLGMEHPGAAGSGEVKTCRGGDIVEAGAEAILKNVGATGLLIYPLGLEE